MTTHSRLLTLLAKQISELADDCILRVAITGVDGAGKTKLANALADRIEERGLPTIRIGIDGFHNPRAVRYARGRQSPEGFYRDSFDLRHFKKVVLEPLSPGGTMQYRTAIFDHHADRAIEAPVQHARPPAVLIVEGIFLLRPELADYWDLSIFLDVPFDVAFRRLARRDGSSPDALADTNRRYREGQLLYFAECHPQERVDLLLDYADFDRPRIVRPAMEFR